MDTVLGKTKFYPIAAVSECLIEYKPLELNTLSLWKNPTYEAKWALDFESVEFGSNHWDL